MIVPRKLPTCQVHQPQIGRSNVVDIYDAHTATWSNATLSGDGRCCLGAAGGNTSFAFFGGSTPDLADVFQISAAVAVAGSEA